MFAASTANAKANTSKTSEVSASTQRTNKSDESGYWLFFFFFVLLPVLLVLSTSLRAIGFTTVDSKRGNQVAQLPVSTRASLATQKQKQQQKHQQEQHQQQQQEQTQTHEEKHREQEAQENATSTPEPQPQPPTTTATSTDTSMTIAEQCLIVEQSGASTSSSTSASAIRRQSNSDNDNTSETSDPISSVAAVANHIKTEPEPSVDNTVDALVVLVSAPMLSMLLEDPFEAAASAPVALAAVVGVASAMASKNRVAVTTAGSGSFRGSSAPARPAIKPGKPSKQAMQRYVVAKRYRRSDDLVEDERYHRRGSTNTSSAGTVVFSRQNPDEQHVVVTAQWRLAEARARERSVVRRLVLWWQSLLGAGPALCRDATVILDHVLLGSDANAADRQQLLLTGVTHVCNCAVQAENHFEGEFVYMHLFLRDAVDESLGPFVQPVTKFLQRVERLRGRVLVHCISGVSRSAALVVAYLMLDKRMRLLDAYQLVRSRRSLVQPNEGFRLQLARLEMALFGSSSVATTQDKDWNFFEWNEMKSSRSVSRARA
ncbi:hypothetical protein P43SY_003814 [Pythium insidiosum]|uniref:protein-tyrosine-phosphatase n=1 Tax=Pythium insidiosum TaxID=114742 RepID=A0AAD5Q6R3_PYTIN|nr:hypothetical protein P43SY_003814 [Pythium insidiosum]